MPGNVGPAWYDTYTTINNEGTFIMEEIDNVLADRGEFNPTNIYHIFRVTRLILYVELKNVPKFYGRPFAIFFRIAT